MNVTTVLEEKIVLFIADGDRLYICTCIHNILVLIPPNMGMGLVYISYCSEQVPYCSCNDVKIGHAVCFSN